MNLLVIWKQFSWFDPGGRNRDIKSSAGVTQLFLLLHFGVQSVTQIVGPIQIWRAIKVERRAH